MKFNKKIFLSSFLACLSFNSCHSLECIKNFFSSPVNAGFTGASTTFIVASLLLTNLVDIFKNVNQNNYRKNLKKTVKPKLLCEMKPWSRIIF